jgi:hypothetical protein
MCNSWHRVTLNQPTSRPKLADAVAEHADDLAVDCSGTDASAAAAAAGAHRAQL